MPEEVDKILEEVAAEWGTAEQLPDTTEPPRFALADPAWIEHLHEEGYAVVRSALDEQELGKAQELLWSFLEEAGGWRRGCPETWTDESLQRFASLSTGIVHGAGVGQSELQWFVRTRPSVRGAFERIWDTKELLSSFDGANVFRPWHSGAFPRTLGGWFHVDQGPTKRGRQAVQGLVALTEQGPRTGGLVVIPGSQKRHDELVAKVSNPSDFVAVSEDSAVRREGARPRLVACEPGDLVLWDSRCVHCNGPAFLPPTCPADELLRAVSYVCMTPKACATEQALEERRRAYELRTTTSHWPHTRPFGLGWGKKGRLDFETADACRRSLIG